MESAPDEIRISNAEAAITSGSTNNGEMTQKRLEERQHKKRRGAKYVHAGSRSGTRNAGG